MHVVVVVVTYVVVAKANRNEVKIFGAMPRNEVATRYCTLLKGTERCPTDTWTWDLISPLWVFLQLFASLDFNFLCKLRTPFDGAC